MNNPAEEQIFDDEIFMEIEENEEQFEQIPEPLYFMNNNNIIYFGFYEKTSNIFYKIEESITKRFTINSNSKKLEIKYKSKYHSHSRILVYNLPENIPYLIKSQTNRFNFNNNNFTEDIILHFSYSPVHKKKRENCYGEPSDFLLENYNKENNLLCFDCPYKTILQYSNLLEKGKT